ncbi:hypothetical protein [Niabella drilacis]|uniref:Lipocalin-like domain-containing protein n=1 Tax=Niabella drilacis (strain DSM 25811 / CCM 8410 / CCUG 62505 / LMG 26954 / E90) TaxID=1285928 RepID=A0A1G7AVT3_NIADE|nr:hypothetical protein [Niabella drilacis]SDE18115.1 hypothetical protein SAMN04487894_12514 [Niabella drilacis]
MKTISKMILGIMITGVFFLGACSRTKDAIGTDTIENMVSVGNWKSVITAAGVDLVPAGGRAEFSKQDHLIHYYDVSGDQIRTDQFAFSNGTKRMTWNNVAYEIKENFVASSKTLTLLDPTSKKMVVAFYRERQ